MKIRYIILYILITILSASIPLYHYNKHFGSNILIDNAVWGQFGDFVGGTLNPFLTFVTFITILFTLRAQLEENKKNELERQITEITNALDLLENTIQPKLEHILFRNYTLPHKDKYRYQMAESLSSDLKLCIRLLMQIKEKQLDNSLISFYTHKYKEIIGILKHKGYLEYDLEHYLETR
ncbi:hypothetical protein [Leptospira perdikensis]|uniref:Phage abortive infection protein n=1 Tax=Leptospira perdikensis TaxID=2484948 RepID=A0A4R9JLC5_9LEPT|nr:hypothetical protein [Leptospira perdikensis]TGL45973.1 hypothetical protein EHQ49_00885 [Leptospira perdikensis]